MEVVEVVEMEVEVEGKKCENYFQLKSGRKSWQKHSLQ